MSAEDSDRPVKKGRFDENERRLLRAAINQYILQNEVADSFEDGIRILCNKSRDKSLRGAWVQIAKAVPGRTVPQVYSFCIRAFSPQRRGKWTPEEVERLKKLVEEHGTQWSKIGKELDRFETSCRDKYRLVKDNFKSGTWTAEEDEKLRKLVEEHTTEIPDPKGGESSTVILWTEISAKIKTRSHSACRNRWYNQLLPEISPPVWNRQHDEELIRNIANSGATSVVNVKWTKITNRVSGREAKRRFKELCDAHVPNHEAMFLTPIIEQLAQAFPNAGIRVPSSPPVIPSASSASSRSSAAVGGTPTGGRPGLPGSVPVASSSSSSSSSSKPALHQRADFATAVPENTQDALSLAITQVVSAVGSTSEAGKQKPQPQAQQQQNTVGVKRKSPESSIPSVQTSPPLVGASLPASLSNPPNLQNHHNQHHSAHHQLPVHHQQPQNQSLHPGDSRSPKLHKSSATGVGLPPVGGMSGGVDKQQQSVPSKRAPPQTSGHLGQHHRGLPGLNPADNNAELQRRLAINLHSSRGTPMQRINQQRDQQFATINALTSHRQLQRKIQQQQQHQPLHHHAGHQIPQQLPHPSAHHAQQRR